MPSPQVGEQYADKSHPGRWVEIKGFDLMGDMVTIETVAAADNASSERAVGKVTEVRLERFARQFRLLSLCTHCGWNDTHRSGSCPVVG